MIFRYMLRSCHITKFCEINFKILSRILVMPKIVAKIKCNPSLQFCAWCGLVANIEYILCECLTTVAVQKELVK